MIIFPTFLTSLLTKFSIFFADFNNWQLGEAAGDEVFMAGQHDLNNTAGNSQGKHSLGQPGTGRKPHQISVPRRPPKMDQYFLKNRKSWNRLLLKFRSQTNILFFGAPYVCHTVKYGFFLYVNR